jgi:hypothetical protein
MTCVEGPGVPVTQVFRSRTRAGIAGNALRTLWHWVYSNVHDGYQAYRVLDFMLLDPVPPGLLHEEHPWVTGISPQTGRPVWPENLVFASPRKADWVLPEPEPDAQIVTRVGRFLAAMVRRSVPAAPEIPQGAARRMPHAVNYLHGSIHFNGGFLLFNDFRDAMYYLSDPAFTREVRRFARQERRELTVVLRERRYEPEEYAWFVAFVRAHLPWYANGNGPTKKRVLWGTPSPYAAVNPINGSWVADMERLRARQPDRLARAPIVPGRYFQGSYRGNQPDFTFLERFHAWVMSGVIRAKGFQGNLVFTRRRTIEPEHWKLYLESHGAWRATYPISHPFAPIERVRARRAARSAALPPETVESE